MSYTYDRIIDGKFATDRAGRAAQQPDDRSLAAAAMMFGECHATFLAAEVLASSVHRNILRPMGSGCCTWNLSLRPARSSAVRCGRAPRGCVKRAFIRPEPSRPASGPCAAGREWRCRFP